MGQGLVFHWAQLQPQEVVFLPLKTTDRLPRKGSVTRSAWPWAGCSGPGQGECLQERWAEAGGAPCVLSLSGAQRASSLESRMGPAPTQDRV